MEYTRRDGVSSACLVFAAVQDSFSHSVGIFFALVLALSDVDTRHHFVPSLLTFHFIVLLSHFLFFFYVLLGSLLLLLFLFGLKLLKLSPAQALSLLLIAPLLLLHTYIITLFYLSRFWTLSYSSLMRLVV